MWLTEICSEYIKDFKTVPYEDRGMFNSEILAVVTIAKELGLRVIESGTARGHSTETIAVNGVDIISIDHSSGKDVQYAKLKLLRYDNCTLVYGDSREVIWDYLDQPCIVLIDGPKGTPAIQFASDLLAKDTVQYACVHDLYKPNPDRDYAEKNMKGIYTDDKQFVDTYKHLDDECWHKLKEINGIPEKPYVRRGKNINSYASTLAIFR